MPLIVDRRTTPAGVVPPRLQQWVLIGIVLVMVAILTLAGPPSKPRAPTAGMQTTPVMDANQQRIEEYQRRLQDQARRLAAEQAELELAKQALAGQKARDGGGDEAGGAGEARGWGQLGGAAQASSQAGRGLGRGGGGGGGGHEGRGRGGEEGGRGGDDGVRGAEGGKRMTLADNVAFSLGETSGARGAARGAAVEARGAQVDARGAQVEARGAQVDSRGAHVEARGAGAEGRYRLLEGTIIETTLTNRLDGTFPGPVNCLVTTPVHAADLQRVLIPSGSRVLGEARAVNTFGQSRLAVLFHRLVFPNGSRVDLNNFHGLNQVGDLGLRDQVDRHYAQIFGASLAVGAIAGLAHARTGGGLNADALDAYRQGAAANIAQSSAHILDRFLNVLPTVTIREGHRIKVYLANDLELPEYRDTNGGGR